MIELYNDNVVYLIYIDCNNLYQNTLQDIWRNGKSEFLNSKPFLLKHAVKQGE